jgi:exodeoxyribonuclease VII small subunit
MAKSSSAATLAALPPDLTFENAMQQLDAIVRQLESGQGSLDDAITHYEKGAALRAFCEQRLKDAELRISQIATAPDGSVTATPFQDTQTK